MSRRKRTRAAHPIVPLILAAGPSGRLAFPKPLADFKGRTALEIAIANCAGLAAPIVVLGCDARRVRPAVPAGTVVVVNRQWRKGQLNSLLAGLERVPRGAPFMLYPVDYPLLTRRMIARLVRAYAQRKAQHRIVVPCFGNRSGHPVVFHPSLRAELERAQTGKAVVERDGSRVQLVPLQTPAIWRDFNTPASYRRCVRSYRRQAN